MTTLQSCSMKKETRDQKSKIYSSGDLYLFGICLVLFVSTPQTNQSNNHHTTEPIHIPRYILNHQLLLSLFLFIGISGWNDEQFQFQVHRNDGAH